MTTPKLPTERALARQFRETHEAYTHPDGGGAHVALCLDFHGVWHLAPVDFATGWAEPCAGREYVPGDECPCIPRTNGKRHARWAKRCTFDAMGPARRLLAAARDAGFR